MTDTNDSGANDSGANDQGDGPDFAEAARAGARRAGIHMVKAGYEVLAGVSAFLEELRKATGEGDEDEGTGRHRIPLDDDDG